MIIFLIEIYSVKIIAINKFYYSKLIVYLRFYAIIRKNLILNVYKKGIPKMNKKRLNYLITKLKQGEKDYFDEFYKKTQIPVYYSIRKVINNKIQIEDVMQETYIKFLKSLNLIDTNNNPLAYLITIAKNKAIDECRKNERIEFVEYIDELQESKSSNDMPLIEMFKNSLTDDEYQLFELTLIYGYKRIEIAKMQNQPVSTVGWKYNKMLEKVKRIYKDSVNENKK